MDYPLISNEGMKGPAVKEILKNHKAQSFFIDDNPYQVESVYNDNQQTVCVHFSVCDLVKPYMPKAVGASIEPTSWQDLVSQLIGCLKDDEGNLIFDAGGGGSYDTENKKVINGGHVWFPRYNSVKELMGPLILSYCNQEYCM